MTLLSTFSPVCVKNPVVSTFLYLGRPREMGAGP